MNPKLDFRQDEAMERLGDDIDLLRMLVETFLGEWDAYNDGLVASQTATEAVEMQKAAHRIKGATSTIGLEGLKDVAYEIESDCKATVGPPSEKSQALAKELLGLMEIAKTDLADWLAN